MTGTVWTDHGDKPLPARVRAWEVEAHEEHEQRVAAYESGHWCGECRYGVVEDPPCCTTLRDTIMTVLDKAGTECSRSFWEDNHELDFLGVSADAVLSVPAVAEALAAQERVTAALALHQPEDGDWCCEDEPCDVCEDGGTHQGKVCYRCSNDQRVAKWPCMTVLALTGGVS